MQQPAGETLVYLMQRVAGILDWKCSESYSPAPNPVGSLRNIGTKKSGIRGNDDINDDIKGF